MSLKQNDRIQAYLDTVSSHIKWREVHDQVKEELLSHLADVVTELKQDGLSEQQAVMEAIHRMGDADELGRQLQQTHKPQKNWPLLAIVGERRKFCVNRFETSSLLARIGIKLFESERKIFYENNT